MTRFGFDSSQKPIYLFTTPSDYSDDDVAQHHADIESLLDTHESIFGLIDMRNTPPPSAKQRKMLNVVLKRRRADLTRYCYGIAYLVDSTIQAAIVNSFQWMFRFPMPIKMFTNESDARAWLKSKQSERNQK